MNRRPLNIQIPTGWLIGLLTGYLGLIQLLLWRFLDVMPLWAYAAAGAAILLLCIMLSRQVAHAQWPRGPSLKTLLTCLGIALALLILGGEGRLLYANVDWQVRDAVLRDMAINPWPFVYTARDLPDVLRGPIGMYFVPALAWKALGPTAADIALLIQNASLLGIIMALAAPLFPDRRARRITLAVFLTFSGLDIVGQLLAHRMLAEHLEFWTNLLQYSSTITLIFWVPHHALIGWMGTVLFLLHRAGRISLGQFLVPLPFAALWSPLALMGLAPFALMAGLSALRPWAIRWTDVAFPALASLIAIPALLYLGSANHEVGARLFPIDPIMWLLFQLIEVLPYLVPVVAIAFADRRDRVLIAMVAASLLLMPLVQIGWSVDFAMRASIPPLTLLMLMVARVLIDTSEGRREARKWLMAMLLIGSATGTFEIARAFRYPAAPWGQCSFFKAWEANFGDYPKGTYLAPLAEIPSLIRPSAPYPVPEQEPARCWPNDWRRPSGL